MWKGGREKIGREGGRQAGRKGGRERVGKRKGGFEEKKHCPETERQTDRLGKRKREVQGEGG